MILAHGIGARSDLPAPEWLIAYGAGGVLLVSFIGLRFLWRRPHLNSAANGVALPPLVQRLRPAMFVATRALGLATFALVFYSAGWVSNFAGSNVAPIAVCVTFWVGVPLVSLVLGDVYWAINPFDTLARLVRIPRQTARSNPGQWTAAAMIFSFVWLELAYYDGCNKPRTVFVWLAGYTVATFAGAIWWGRDWLRAGEGFGGLFGLIGEMGIWFRDPESGQLRIRPPFTGLARVRARPGTVALVIVALGSTSFDGFSRTTMWTSILGQRLRWSHTLVATVGLLWVIALVGGAYLLATRVAAGVVGEESSTTSRRFAASLVPIVAAYAIAHYFSLLVFESQNLYLIASDPFGRGWDLFGISGSPRINYSAVTPRQIAFVQVGAIVVGHVVGVVAAHDRAIESYPAEDVQASQYPLLGVMVLFTTIGLLLLLGG